MKTRLYKIDVLRFIAALSVVLYHYTYRGFAADNLSKLNFPFIGKLFQNGYLGVDLFFIISGFVILMSAENVDLKGFIKSRITRLYPAFWICVSITAVVIFLMNDKIFNISIVQYLANLTMLNGFVGIKHIDGVYWSLMNEIQFYCMIAVLLFFNKIKTNYVDIFIAAWLGLSLLTLCFDFKSILILKIIKSIFILDFSSYFIAGMLFYKIYRDGFSVYKFTLIAICCVLSILIAVKRAALLSEVYHTHFSTIATIVIIFSFYIAILFISTGKLKFLNQSFFVKIGALTYPLYLIHQNIAYIIFNTFGSDKNKHWLLISVIALMILVSFLINKYIEVPISRWLKSYLNKVF